MQIRMKDCVGVSLVGYDTKSGAEEENRMKNRLFQFVIGFFISLSILLMIPSTTVRAEETAQAVTVGTIDYDNLTLTVKKNGNTVIYYSTDKKTWYEVDGWLTSDEAGYEMDISWVSSTKDTIIYFKGDEVTTVISVTLPKTDTTFKATFDKANLEFDFSNCDDATSFEWKKSTDYEWNTVSMDTTTASYKNFMEQIEGFLVKGIKMNIRIPQVLGTGEVEPGTRPSKVVTLSLIKRANAPTISVNSLKLTLNTTTKYEYYEPVSATWVECDKAMTLEDIAPLVLYKNGAHDVTLLIRTAATSSKTYSKTAFIQINGQAAAPSIGGASTDVSYYYANNKLYLTFNQASKANIYSYTIVKPGDTLNVATAKFTTVNNNKVKQINQSQAPEGSLIYVRKQGVNANKSKDISLVLSSEMASFTVKY